MILYDYILSSDCYKVRLLLAMLGVGYEVRKVNVHPGREGDGPAFRAVHPLGRIPVLDDDGLVLRDASAILTYLALKHGPDNAWMPRDATGAASVVQWLEFGARDLEPLSRLRFDAITSAGAPDPADVDASYAALTALDDHLAEREIVGAKWLVGDRPTIADLAVFPPAAMAPDADLSLDTFPSLWRWLDHVKALPGFIVMPGVMPSLAGVV